MALTLTFYPAAAARPMEVFSRALMDRPLLDAFGYRRPPGPVVRAARAGLRARARVEALLPARSTPVSFRDSPRMRSYPDGYDVDAPRHVPSGLSRRALTGQTVLSSQRSTHGQDHPRLRRTAPPRAVPTGCLPASTTSGATGRCSPPRSPRAWTPTTGR